jgi:hypothetical protein
MKTKIKISLTILFLCGLVAAQSSYDGNQALQGPNDCSAFGKKALKLGTNNQATAVGFEAMYCPQPSTYNYSCTALGARAFRMSNAGGYVATWCTALGYESLTNNLNGGWNTATGYHALYSNTVGKNNTATGSNALLLNTSGNDNTAVGKNALMSNAGASGTFGDQNTALGADALHSSIDGDNNTAIGNNSLYNLQHGSDNTAAGFNALYSAAGSSASHNSALGHSAMYSNSTGYNNTAAGKDAMYANTTGYENAAVGYLALNKNTNGIYNSVAGANALSLGTSVSYNTAVGDNAMLNSTGSYNTAVGYNAYSNCAANGSGVTAIGFSSLLNANPGNAITAIGASANTLGNYQNATAFGYASSVNASNKVVLGNGSTILIMGNPLNWTTWSDKRFKSNVSDGVKGLEFILKLRPVVYNLETRKLEEFLTRNMGEKEKAGHFKQDFVPSITIRRSGFIAQEVEKAMKECNYDFDGLYTPQNENDTYAVCYGLFVVPLTKAVQQQDKMIVEEKAAVSNLLEQASRLDEQLAQQRLGAAGIEAQQGPEGFSMDIRPNPFSYETVINYTLPANIKTATLVIMNLEGREMQSKQIVNAGNSSMTLTSDNLSAGIYLYSIVSEGKTLGTKRMIVSGK